MVEADHPGDTRAEYLARVEKRQQELRDSLQALFTHPAELTFEVGCGHGHFLAAYAQAHPDNICLGVDIRSRRIRLAQAKSEKRRIKNLHFIKAEAIETLRALPPKVSILNTFVLFPDPWPKKRHAKNRIMQDPFLLQLAARSLPGSRLYFRTDDQAYFRWTAEVLEHHPMWEPRPTAPWPFEAPSYFQDLLRHHQSMVAECAPGGFSSPEANPDHPAQLA